MEIGDTLPRVELQTATGETVELGDYLDRLLLVQALRYYG